MKKSYQKYINRSGLFFCSLTSSFFFTLALTLTPHTSFSGVADDSDKIKKQINTLFESMEKGDSTLLRSVFHKQARMLTVYSKKGETILQEESVNEFAIAVGTPHKEIWKEKVTSWKIEIDGDLASVWTEYEFHLDNKFLHCGVNAFHLVRSGTEWKIIQITDTRRKECAQTENIVSGEKRVETLRFELNNVIDNWHKAAARGDSTRYFGLMADDFIYLGTDRTERWSKTAFWEFSKKYFNRKEGAWNFKPLNRELYFTSDLKYVWFEENLDTWMGFCRGTGVISHSAKDGWKLRHYNLSVTIDNDKVQKFIEISK